MIELLVIIGAEVAVIAVAFGAIILAADVVTRDLFRGWGWD